MDLGRVEQLLAKYWECNTSQEEEHELREFFNSGSVPDHLQSVAALFQYYVHEKEGNQLDSLFDKQILAQLKQQGNGVERSDLKGRIVSMFTNVAKVAAVILILATAAYFVREEYMTKRPQLDPYITDTFDDPQEAFEETKKALLLISKNFNKGRREAQKVGVFNEAQQKIKDTETL